MSKYERPLTAEELAALDDKDIDFSDQPELSGDFWSTARVRGGRRISDQLLSSGD
ncbi:hypothetical protein [Palleronia caenipelagi]|uniref:hypothetical protein n=1 Tax=Palleronia caenipelagi TaxID=2489174 RepID=UPI00163D9380|nr:hypothetical protein [Palleronia caenipelagi]